MENIDMMYSIILKETNLTLQDDQLHDFGYVYTKLFSGYKQFLRAAIFYTFSYVKQI